MFKFIISWQCILHPPSPVLLANEVDLLILIFYASTNQDPSFNCQVCLMFRYEHSNLSKERIAELVRESLAAVGLKVIVCLPLLTKWTVVWHIACMAFADSGWNYQYNCFFGKGCCLFSIDASWCGVCSFVMKSGCWGATTFRVIRRHEEEGSFGSGYHLWW